VEFSGLTEFAAPGNVFGLGVGDELFGETLYEDTLLTGVGSEQLAYAGSECFFSIECGTLLTFTIGPDVLNQDLDDRAFLEGNPGPLVFFEDGLIVGFHYAPVGGKLSVAGVVADFNVWGTLWRLTNTSTGDILALGNYTRFAVPSPVPEPSVTVGVLLGLALILGLGPLRNARA
jgi:hypothetical protein